MSAPATKRKSPRTGFRVSQWLPLVLLASLGVGGTGCWYFLKQRQIIQADRYNELHAIAQMKAAQIVSWRVERLSDARLYASQNIGPLALAWLTNGPALQAAMRERLQQVARIEGYPNLLLTAPDGRILLSLAPCTPPADPAAKQLALRAAATRTAVFGDFFRCTECREIFLDVAVPLLDPALQPAAVLILRTNPEEHLYPLIQSWPLPSRSAETLLVRQDGSHALLLNRLRHSQAPALTLRLPLSDTEVTEVQAVLGKTGLVSGKDYRGEPVKADLLPIPGTAWFMVAKVNTQEIMAEVNYRGQVILIFACLVILLILATLAVLFYFGQANLLREAQRATLDAADEEAPVSDGMTRSAKKETLLASGMVVFSGGLVLIGWFLDWDTLKGGLPGHVSMMPNTAAGLMLAGLALAALACAETSRLLLRITQTCAAAVAVLGLCTLAEYFLGVDLGIDQFLFRQPAGTPETLAPGRMLPTTALNLLLTGSALLLSSALRRARIAQGLMLAAMLLAWLPLLGYIYGANHVYDMGLYTRMSVLSAISFLFLGLGLLFQTHREGFVRFVLSDNLGAWLLRRMLPFVVLVPLMIGWLGATGHRMGFYESIFGGALTMLAMTIVTLGLLWWSARALSRIDALRRSNERQVHQSHELLRATLYGIGDVVVATDVGSLITQMNPMAEQFTGCTETESLGRPLHEVYRIIDEGTRDLIDLSAGLRRAGNPGEKFSHALLVARDGTARPVTGTCAPIHDRSGNPMGMVLVLHDQSAARAAEARIQAEMEKLVTVFECAPVAMLVINEQANIVWANTAAIALADASAAENMQGQRPGHALHCLHTADDPRGCGLGRECPLCPLRRGLLTVIGSNTALFGAEISMNLYRHGLPSQVWLRVGMAPLLLDNRKHVIVALDDITSRKQLENQTHAAREEANRLLATSDQSRLALLGAIEDNQLLAEQQQHERQRLENILEGTRAGTWEWNVQTGATVCNERWAQILGYSLEELAPVSIDTWNKLTHPDDLQNSRALLARHSAGEFAYYEYEIRMKHKDGRWIPILDRGQIATRTPDGKPLLMFGTHIDITERKQAEALRLSKEAADAASRAKSTFLAHMSHEIRTPLNAILGFAQLLLRDPVITIRQRQQIETINRSGEHLLALVEDVLTMTRIEAGRMELNTVAFDCAALLTDVARMFQPRLLAKQLQFDLQLAPGLPRFAKADVGKLREVLINLLGNAVKFTARGRVSLRVEITRPADGPHLQFQVEDTGPGIALADQSRVFRYFEQTHAGTTSGTGSGLGLAISRELVRLMGGDITFSSEVGKGSTFRFDMRIELVDHADVQPVPAERRVLGPQPGQPPVRLLVADDNADNRELLLQMLAPAGFETRQAANGRQALHEFETWHPRLILLDLRMPEMDGMEALRQIRLRPGGRNVRIIVVTASVLANKSREILDAGADAFFVKPFQETEMFEKIGELLEISWIWTDSMDEPPAVVLPTPEELAKLPAELRRTLRTAVVRGDFDQVQEQIARVAEIAPTVAQALHKLANRYDSHSLLQLLDEGGEREHHA
ncbi:MAG: PAS domain S-box protein [bacterium]